MPKVSLNEREGRLEISSYDGSQKNQTNSLELPVDRNLSNQGWNFFRQKSNHAYVRGNILYEGECGNSLIISPYGSNKLVGVKNAFILVDKSNIEISPIFNISNVIKKGKEILFNQKVNYNIPESVVERENLVEKDLRELKENIIQKYGIKSKKIIRLDSGRAKNGIYYIKEENSKGYILKFRGRDKERAELLSRIAESIPRYFPLNFPRKDKNQFTFQIKDEFYGVEEFIKDESSKVRNLRYFSLLGKHIGLLHNHFLEFTKKNKGAREILSLKDEYSSESNIASLYLDLSMNEQNKFLLSELEKIITENLNVKINSFSKEIIHKDLNHSNLVWEKETPNIIDSETISLSVRLNEFQSPLLFEENMKKPEYINNSLEMIVDAYNQTSKNLLSKGEIEVLPLLVRYSLLKNFVIRNIRRRFEDKNGLNQIKINLERLEGSYENF